MDLSASSSNAPSHPPFWSEEGKATWPVSSSRWIFLAHAIDELGRALHPTSWRIDDVSIDVDRWEKAGFLNRPARGMFGRSHDAQVAEAIRLREQSVSSLLQRLREELLVENIKCFARDSVTGQMVAGSSAWWTTDKFIDRFRTCKIDPRSPGLGSLLMTRGDWLFLDRHDFSGMIGLIRSEEAIAAGWSGNDPVPPPPGYVTVHQVFASLHDVIPDPVPEEIAEAAPYVLQGDSPDKPRVAYTMMMMHRLALSGDLIFTSRTASGAKDVPSSSWFCSPSAACDRFAMRSMNIDARFQMDRPSRFDEFMPYFNGFLEPIFVSKANLEALVAALIPPADKISEFTAIPAPVADAIENTGGVDPFAVDDKGKLPVLDTVTKPGEPSGNVISQDSIFSRASKKPWYKPLMELYKMHHDDIYHLSEIELHKFVRANWPKHIIAKHPAKTSLVRYWKHHLFKRSVGSAQ